MVDGGAQYFKVNDSMRRDVGALKSPTSRFKYDNFRRYRKIGLRVMRIVDRNVEVTGDDEVMGGCGGCEKKR